MVNFTIRAHIRMSAPGMLDVPMKFILFAAGMGSWAPLIPVQIKVSALLASWRVPPITSFRQDKWVVTYSRQ